MPERDDIHDPIDEAYVRAEQALDDEAARAARRARVLAAAAQEPTPAPAAKPAARSLLRRYGGWLAAAGVAGISVLTAEQVNRLSPRRQQFTPPAVQPPAPATMSAAPPPPPAPPPAASPAPAPATPPVDGSPASPKAEPAKPAPPVVRIAPRPPVAPPPDIAPPPPLPIPPVEKPFASPPPPPPIAAAPAAPLAAQKPNAFSSEAAGKVQEDVVVTGTRQQRAASPNAGPVAVAPKLDGARSLREAAAAGRTKEIDALLALGVPVDAADDAGETALMKSVQNDYPDAVEILRRHGASLDRKNNAGKSARDMAKGLTDPDLAKALGLTP
ncbi:MAG TPA: ankyrin repeat domain-containing protein [Caulobacteraceae bacterium]|jgi:hypothetical protein